MNARKPPCRSDLRGVLITGAASSIGRHVTERLVGHDDLQFVLTSNKSTVTKEITARPNVEARGGLDLTHPGSLAVLRECSEKCFDGPFGLVHSVGDFWCHRMISEVSVSEAAKMMSSHYTTLYGVLHTLLPVMKKLGGGRVLAFSCTSVGFNYPEMAAFTSAKAAVEALVRCVANEWGGFGIAANSIALSTVDTPDVRKTKPLANMENYLSAQEIGVLVEDILLASGPYLSGNVVRPLKYSKTFYGHAYFARNPPSTCNE